MSRNIRLYLEDIKSSGRLILDYTHGMTFEAFVEDRRTRYVSENNDRTDRI